MSDTLVLGAGDVVTAALEWLEDDTDLLTAAEARMYGHELPASEATAMPRRAIVVGEAGGYVDDLPEVLDRARLDIRAYGATLDEAKALAVMVRDRFRALHRFTASNGVVLHPALRSGSFIPLREPVGDWPLVLRSYLVVYDVRAAA